MDAQERSKKTSVTQLVHSTIGSLGLVTAEPNSPSATPSSPEEAMASRLQFNAKTSAGSVSSDKVATSQNDLGMSSLDRGQRPTRGRLLPQPSQENSVFYDDVEATPPLPALQPRDPTGQEPKRLSSDTDVMGVQEALKFIQAGQNKEQATASAAMRDRSMSLQPNMAAAAEKETKIMTTPISWEEDAVTNKHLFCEVDTREGCYYSDTMFCQQAKLFQATKRQKLRCSACKVMVHASCLDRLKNEGVHCKDTFREIKQKVRDTVVVHHFLNRRKPTGRSKCNKCDRGFGNWKLSTGREVMSVSCSWCGDTYHLTCFSPHLHKEPCHLGPLRHLLVPPSWIVRTPFIPSAMERSVSQGDESPTPKTAFTVSRRKSRKTKRKKLENRPSKFFKVKALSQHQKPLLVFINPKSGGNQGARLLRTFQWLLNPRQVFDLSKTGPRFGLQMFQDLGNVRILACGGDGTVGWVLSVIDELCIKPFPPVAVLPLGTGNDLSRVLGWGAGYSDEPLDKILMHVEEGPVVELDRWQISVWPNTVVPVTPDSKDGVDDVPLHVVNNYFSIGADAQVALEFHLGREANPEKFNNRIKNKFFYTKLGGRDLLQRKFSDLTDYVEIQGDGIDLTQHIRAQRLEAICFLNIPSHGAGTNPWGTPSARDSKFHHQATDDGKIEVVGFWASTFPKLQMGLSHGERIAQCTHIKMYTTKTLPVQIDGEPCRLKPSIVELVQKNTAQMVRKVARRYSEAPLRGVAPTEPIKLSVSKVTREQYNRLHSNIQELRRSATALGLIVSSVEDNLGSVRSQVESFTTPDEDGSRPLSVNWRFLDTATSGRVERMFQVLPDQELTMKIGNMPSDGFIVVEMDSALSQIHLPKLLSPDGDDLLPPPLGSYPSRESSPVENRGIGRTQSYRRATSPSSDLCPLPPRQPAHPPGRQDHLVPAEQGYGRKRSISSNASEDGYDGDSENPSCISQSPSPSPLHIFDMGLDSTGGDTDAGATPSSVQKALIDAVKRGDVKKVKEHHESGAKLTVTDANGWTALHHAARLGKYEVVEYLVARLPKAALDLVEEEKQQTPLHKAAWYAYINICKLLVENGASLFRKDYQGNTAYLQAKTCGDVELQKYLRMKETEQKSLERDEEAAI